MPDEGGYFNLGFRGSSKNGFSNIWIMPASVGIGLTAREIVLLLEFLHAEKFIFRCVHEYIIEEELLFGTDYPVADLLRFDVYGREIFYRRLSRLNPSFDLAVES